MLLHYFVKFENPKCYRFFAITVAAHPRSESKLNIRGLPFLRHSVHGVHVYPSMATSNLIRFIDVLTRGTVMDAELLLLLLL